MRGSIIATMTAHSIDAWIRIITSSCRWRDNAHTLTETPTHIHTHTHCDDRHAAKFVTDTTTTRAAGNKLTKVGHLGENNVSNNNKTSSSTYWELGVCRPEYVEKGRGRGVCRQLSVNSANRHCALGLFPLFARTQSEPPLGGSYRPKSQIIVQIAHTSRGPA